MFRSNVIVYESCQVCGFKRVLDALINHQTTTKANMHVDFRLVECYSED
jgi:hypothetical protein